MSVILFLILVVVATGCALTVAQRLPWTDAARSDGVPLAVAAGLAPLLAGLATVIALWIFPTERHAIHVAAVFGLLAIGAIPGTRTLAAHVARWPLRLKGRIGAMEWVLGVLLAGFAAAVVMDAVTTPLVQNDALEYATVGRILFESGDLRAYPVLDAEATASGFYAPWTHPPLYVALAYLTYALQGDAGEATLFRLIAPWCLLAATLCVAAVGRRMSRESGLLAALICISTPMLYLGAASSQIDALPVLGFALAFASFTSLGGDVVRRGVVCGLPLGLSLWTHSQAILYPALLVPVLLLTQSGTGGFSRRLAFACKAGALAVAVAVLIGGAPYVRNYMLFGAPISDNPAVFAYAPLGWDDFFKWQRGLAHTQEIVQYGVLKGFFAVEVFSIAFWLALLGVPTALNSAWTRITGAGVGANAKGAVCLPAALIAVAIYFGGMVLSALLGIDIMIRNERYLLVLMPCVALLAAAGMDRSLSTDSVFWRRARTFLLITVTVMLSAQLAALAVYRQKIVNFYAGVSPAASVGDLAAKDASEYLRRYTPTDARVLALRPADMFSTARRMVSYLDPQLMPFYREQQPGPAFAALQRAGIDYVQLPDYALPPIYNSQLMSILADDRYTELLYDRRGYQIYRLRDQAGGREHGVHSAQELHWRRVHRLKLGSLGIGQITVGEFDYASGQPVEAWNESLLLRRMTTTTFVSDAVRTDALACPNAPPPDEYSIELQGAGEGFIQVMVDVQSADGTVERKSIGGVALAGENRQTTFAHRIRVLPHARSIGVEVEFRPIATVQLQRAEVRPVCSQAADMERPVK